MKERWPEMLEYQQKVQAMRERALIARQEGAEQASGEIRALRKALHDETMKRLASAEDMRERAEEAIVNLRPVENMQEAAIAAIRALPLTP